MVSKVWNVRFSRKAGLKNGLEGMKCAFLPKRWSQEWSWRYEMYDLPETLVSRTVSKVRNVRFTRNTGLKNGLEGMKCAFLPKRWSQEWSWRYEIYDLSETLVSRTVSKVWNVRFTRNAGLKNGLEGTKCTIYPKRWYGLEGMKCAFLPKSWS